LSFPLSSTTPLSTLILKNFVKLKTVKQNVLKIVLIIVNINKDENKSLISHQFSLKNDPPPHFLENYFAEVKIKNDHMIDKMGDRVKHANRNYSAILATLQITSYTLGV
jgi:hypothetical protein